jgi:hypothetical protein
MSMKVKLFGIMGALVLLDCHRDARASSGPMKAGGRTDPRSRAASARRYEWSEDDEGQPRAVHAGSGRIDAVEIHSSPTTCGPSRRAVPDRP